MLKSVSNKTFNKCFFMVSKETFQNKRFINILKMFNLKRFFWDGFETKWNVSKTFHVCWVCSIYIHIHNCIIRYINHAIYAIIFSLHSFPGLLRTVYADLNFDDRYWTLHTADWYINSELGSIEKGTLKDLYTIDLKIVIEEGTNTSF